MMHSPSTNRGFRSLGTTLVIVVIASGCAGMPRIDPTGEHFFLPAGEATPSAVVGGTTYVAPPVPPTFVPPPSGNIDVPPIYAQPTTPTLPAGTLPQTNPFAMAQVVSPLGGPVSTPAGPAVAGGGVQAVVTQPTEYIRVLPEQVLAPIGSEVVLRAGICCQEGHLLANQRVEWMLSQDGVGEFITLNDRGQLDIFRWPWNTPRKIDNTYAVGATATYARWLRRGTANPGDDVQILRGEAWVSVTSPAEGTSYVTAYTPVLDSVPSQRATATIYWVDAQWVFPQSTGVELGQSHVLNTMVSRRSDGAPLAGYVVRYEVVGGNTASLGYDQGTVSEVLTDSQGRASIEVRPSDNRGGTSTVNITILRPPQSGVAAGPELELGRGTVMLSWGAAGSGATTPPVVSPTDAVPPTGSSIAPAAPLETPGSFQPPADQPPAGQPEIEVRLSNMGSATAEVGDFVRFELQILNRGNSTAREIIIRDRFGSGLRVPNVSGQAVEKSVRDLGPGESVVEYLSFEVISPGRLCHDVTVSDSSGSRAFEQACVDATEPPPAVHPTLDVVMQGPAQQVVGDVTRFKIIIRNTGEVPVANVSVENQYPQEFVPIRVAPGHEHLQNRKLQWKIDELGVGERREFQLEYKCTAATRSACNLVNVRSDGPRFYAAEKCIEILPLVGAPPGVGATSGNPVPLGTAAGGLQLSVTESTTTPTVGSQMTITVLLVNRGATPQQALTLRIRLPEGMKSVPIPGQLPSRYRFVGNDIEFEPIGEIRSGEPIRILIPVSVAAVAQGGESRIGARVESPNLTTPLEAYSNVINIKP